MGTTAWPLALYLFTLLKPGSGGLVQLHPSPKVLYAECGTEVILRCEVSSPKSDLLVKHMGWALNGTSLCSMEGKLSSHSNHSLRPFHCLYSHGHLSLHFHDVQLLDGWNSTYICKLRSNKGSVHKTTAVKFKETNKCLQSGGGTTAQKSKLQRVQNGVGSVRAIRALWCIFVLVVILR